MACLVNRVDGKVVSVEKEGGGRSQLFDEIHSNIFLVDGETSLTMYKNALSDEVKSRFGKNEPKLYYNSPNNVRYDNLEELLLNEHAGTIQMGFFDESAQEFLPIAKFSNDSAGRGQYLTSMVKQGLMSAERVIAEDGTPRFQGKGEYETSRRVTAEFAADQLRSELGIGEYQIFDDGSMEISFNKELITAELEDGSERVIMLDHIPEWIEKNPTATNKATLMTEYVLNRANPRPLTQGGAKMAEVNVNPADVERSLKQFLKSVGFSTTTLEEYRKNYNTKYGKDPDIEALADIANKVVAIGEGRPQLDNLSEEVAHIAIELYNDQSSIAGALVNIHKTEEYAEFADYYRQKYSSFSEGVELEDHVRKEVLGKILKAQIKERFDTTEVTEERADLIGRLKTIWNNFVKYIKGRLKPQHIRVINKINTDIANSIYTQDASEFQNTIKGGAEFYYNAMDKGHQKAKNELDSAKRVIEELYRKVLEQDVPNQSEIDALEESIEDNSIMSAFNTVVGVTAAQMETVEAAIKYAAKSNTLISQKDINAAHLLDASLVPILNNVRNAVEKLELKDDKLKDRLSKLSEVTDEINIKIAAIKPELKKDNEGYVERAVKEAVESADLTAKEEKELRQNIEGGIKDTSVLGKMFGLISHSSNPLIGLMHKTINSMYHKVRSNFNKRLNNELAEMEEGGLLKYQKDVIQKGTGYYKSPFRWDKYEADLAEQKIKALVDITGKSEEDIKKAIDKGISEAAIADTNENYKEFKSRIKEWRDTEGVERRNTDEHYAKREARYAKANVSKDTQDYISKKNSNIYNITRKYQDKDGTTDKSKISEADKVAIRKNKELNSAQKSPYDSAGNFKPGITRVSANDLTESQRSAIPVDIDPEYTGDITVLEEGQILEELTAESRRALDMFHLDMLFRSELKDSSKTNKPLEKFISELEELEKTEGGQAFDWAEANTTIGLTSEFYEGLGHGTSFTDVAEEYLTTLPQEERVKKARYLKEFKELQGMKKDLLKQNRKDGNAIETDAFHMTVKTRATAIDLDGKIAKAKRALNIPFELQEQVSGLEGTESDLTDDFKKMLAESELSTYEFSLKHMTEDNLVKVKSFALEVEDVLNGIRTQVKPSYNNFLTEVAQSGKIPQGSSKEEALQIAKDEYAKRFLASYFRRFQPTGYAEAMADLKSGKIKVSELLNNREEVVAQNPGLGFVEITPDYTWSEDINNGEYLNKAFKEGLTFTPKMDKYLDKDFFNHYGISIEEYRGAEKDDLSLLKPSKNIEEYDMLSRLVKLREETTEIYGDTGRTNKYLRPQVSNDAVDKAFGLVGKDRKSVAKDWVSDIFESKIDEKAYGEVTGGSGSSEVGVKIIPKYYQNKVDPELLTDNTMQAAMADYERALMYKEQTASERKLKAFEDKIANQQLIDGGASSIKGKIFKKKAVSNFYEKTQETLDYHLYGIRQNRKLKQEILGREVDFTQVVKGITKVTARVNLVANPIVDATSYATGVYNNVVDAFIGEYYTGGAALTVTKKLPKMVAEYTLESGNIKKKSELGHLTEFFGVIDASDRLKHSARNKGVRLLGKSGFGLSKAANLFVTPKVMLCVLHDMKYADGKFRSYNSFRKIHGVKTGLTGKELSSASKDAWKDIKETLYDNISIDKDKGVNFNSKFSEKYPESTEEAFLKITEEVSSKISQIVQSVDGMVNEADKTQAHRDVLTNSFMLHRSWILSQFTKKFKAKHFNFATGQSEEGYYRTFGRLVMETAMELGNKDVKFGTAFKNLDEAEGRSVKRAKVSSIGLVLLSALGYAILAGDDEDDSAIEDFMQLIAIRTVAEAQTAGLVGTANIPVEVYDTPLIQMRNIVQLKKALFKTADGEFGDALDEARKATILKRYNQLSDIQRQVDTFRHFNGSNLWLTDGF